MSRAGIISKIIAATLIGGALITGGVLYRLNPTLFERVEPAVEGIINNVTEEKQAKAPALGRYRCNIVDEQRVERVFKCARKRICGYHDPYSSKNYSLDIDVTSASPELITLKSNESDFNGTLDFTYRNEEAALTSYQNFRAAFGTQPEGIDLWAIDDGSLHVSHEHWFSLTRSRVKYGSCTLVSTPITFVRGVFIRPCPGQLYAEPLSSGNFRSDENSGQLDPEKLANIETIPVGTLGGVCQDLMDSGVTDIFIPFRVDALPPDDRSITPHCGYHGQLLYPSIDYRNRVSQKVRDAQEAGFDLIGSLMQVCRHVYGDTPVRFNAWFPVFNDPYAAQLRGTTGKLKFNLIGDGDIVGSVVDQVVAGVPMADPTYTSRLFADPRNARVVTYELAVLNEIMRTYPDLSGINLDYIRYPEEQSVNDLPMRERHVVIEARPECIRDPRVDDIQRLPCECEEGDTSCVAVDPQHIVKRIIWEVDGSAVDNFVRRVRQKFPDIILSADVFASAGGRSGVGQLEVPGLVDVIMPMTYSYFGQKGSEDTERWVAELGSLFPSKTIVPCVRGWSRDWVHGSSSLITDLRLDILAVRNADGNGYSIFTYESLLDYARARGNGSTLTVLKSTIGY